MPPISVGAALALLLSIAAANAEDGAGILPHAVSRPPAYESLATGPLRVRLFPGQRAPCLQHYVNLDTPSSVANLVAAVERHGI
ncbi:MAG: hypothetical protein ACKO6E_07325, partial [Planctomycetota bacterium]